ncbi:oligosaccharide flippase family protein [candidate division KSB1 bacterium]|nr:oligosaccharide flippase family protein [candidate division KSB1 bacterium]
MKLRELVQDTALYGFSSAITRAFMLMLIPILISTLSVDEFGVISLFQFYVGIGIILFLLGMDQALIRDFPSADNLLRQKLLSTSVIFLGSMALLSSILFLFLRNHLMPVLFKELHNGNILFWLWIIIIAEGATLIQSVIFRAEQKSRLYFRNTLIKYGFLLIISWILLKVVHAGLNGVFLAYLVSNILYTIFSIPVWKLYFRLRFSSTILKKMLVYGLPLLPAGLLNLFLFFADHYLIQQMMDLKAVGQYAFGYKFGAVLYYLIAALNNAWYPRLFSMEKRILEINYHRLLVCVAWISMAVFLIVDSIFRFFHPWFVPDAYIASIPIISLVGLAYIIHNIASFADSLFFYAKKVGYISIMVGIGLISNLSLNWILIPRIGIMGAALATLAAFFIYLVLVLMILKKLEIIPIHYGETMKLLTGFSILYGVSYLVTPEGFIARLLVMVMMIFLFITSSWMLSYTFRSTIQSALGHIKKRRNSD